MAKGKKGSGKIARAAEFKVPTRIPQSLESLSPSNRDKIGKKLVPHPEPAPPEAVIKSVRAMEPQLRRFHGMRAPFHWFPRAMLTSPCGDKFGYRFSKAVRNASKLPFNAQNRALLDQLGNLMGDPARDTGPDSTIPAGYTYFGQFVDHDITLDVTSSIETATNAETIPNMRTPALELDSVYGRGPALEPFYYRFPGPTEPPTAIRMAVGRNQNTGAGGPTDLNFPEPIPVTRDVPRVLSGTKTTNVEAESTFTAIIGDPRNDENVIVSQIHHAMLRFHNKVVDLLVAATPQPADIFTEARKVVRQHYQWCVVHDFLVRVCGAAEVNHAIAHVHAPVGSAFRMPVEFSVAAYRFGHSMVRDRYRLNFSLPDQISNLERIFAFIRVDKLPLFSNWVVDFNLFFNTARPIGFHFNNARKIDTILAGGLEGIPGGAGIMAVLAARNLRRGLAMGLPSGQAAARALGFVPLTQAQLTASLPADELAILNLHGKRLLKKTPLWYYVLREAAVLQNGDQLGPVGARIVAENFVRMLKRDPDSFMNVPGFTPSLPSSAPGTFMIADLLEFAGVLVREV